MMFMMYQTLVLAFACFAAPLLGKLAGCELQGRPFGLVGASGLFFLLTVAFGLLPIENPVITSIWYVCGVISYFIGWITLLIGTVWELVDVLSPASSHERAAVHTS